MSSMPRSKRSSWTPAGTTKRLLMNSWGLRHWISPMPTIRTIIAFVSTSSFRHGGREWASRARIEDYQVAGKQRGQGHRCHSQQAERRREYPITYSFLKLDYAVLAKNLELVNLLIKEGAKTNIKNDSNRTPFKESI